MRGEDIMKNKILAALLTISMLLPSLSMFSMVQADELNEAQIFFLDTQSDFESFVAEQGYASENVAVSYNTDQRAMQLQFGSNSENGKPKLQIPVKDKYKYVNILIGVNNPFGRKTSSATEGFKSEIGYTGSTAVCPYTIKSNGGEMTVDGTTYKKNDDYRVHQNDDLYLSVTTEIDISNAADGENIIDYIPAYIDGADNCGDSKGYMFIKAISFFNTESDAEEFQSSLKGAKCTIRGIDYPATIDYVARTVELNLPKGVTSDTLSASDITLDIINDAYVSGELVLDEENSTDTEFVYKLDVKKNNSKADAQDIDEKIWTINITSVPATDAEIENAVLLLNQLTSAEIDSFKTNYEWLLDLQSLTYKGFTDEQKNNFYNDVAVNNSLPAEEKYVLTKDNIDAYAKKYLIYSEKSDYTSPTAEAAVNISEFANKLEAAGIKDAEEFDIFFNQLTEEEQNELLLSSGALACSVSFFNNIKNSAEAVKKGNLVAEVNRQESPGGIKNVVESNLKLFGLTSDEYEKLCAKTNRIYEAYQILVGKAFTTPEAVINALTQAINSIGIVPESTPKPVDNVRPSGSSGGGGGSISIPKPTATPSAPAENPDASDDEKNSFSDINSVPWAADYIEKLSSLGVISGKGDGKFAPNDDVLREEYVAMIVLAFGITQSGSDTKFADVLTDKWYAKFISAAVENGFISGISDGEFGIGESITREDIAVIAYRVITALNPDIEIKDGTAFEDSDNISDYAKDAVKYLSATGVINGDNGKFYPKNKATRAEVAVIIVKLLEILDNKGL